MALPETFVPGFHDEEAVKKMKYNKLGNTGLMVSAISLGTGGFSYFYGDYDIEECKQTIHEAIRKGINFIDTAPWYGHGVSEEILGKCLEGIPRKAYYVATKTGRYEKDPKLMFDFSRKKTLESIDVSLKKLGVNYVDLLQVHDVEFAPTLDTVLNETLPTIEEFVKDGKVKFIGVAGYPVSTLTDCIEKSKVPIDTVLSYCRQTMFDNTLASFLPRLKAKGVGIINAAVNAMGLLTSYGPPDWHPAHQEIKDACTDVRQYCKQNNVELGKLAVYHSLQQEGPNTVLVGMNTRTILNINLDVVYNGLSETEEKVYKEVLNKFKNLSIRHWEDVELLEYKKAIAT